MLIVSYDIADDKVRTRFSRFLQKFGFRLQYLVFEIHNSEHILKIIMNEIANVYEKTFTEEDSIVIFKLSETCEKISYGYAKNNSEDFILVSS